jgi:hypothetical protein
MGYTLADRIMQRIDNTEVQAGHQIGSTSGAGEVASGQLPRRPQGGQAKIRHSHKTAHFHLILPLNGKPSSCVNLYPACFLRFQHIMGSLLKDMRRRYLKASGEEVDCMTSLQARRWMTVRAKAHLRVVIDEGKHQASGG